MMRCKSYQRFLVCFVIVILVNTVFAYAEQYDFTYDANGNMLQGKDNFYEYNSFNQLVRVRGDNSTGRILSEYVYGPGDRRVLKVEYFADGSNETTYYVNKNFIRMVNSSGTFDTTYYYHDDTLVGREDYDGKKYFYHPDHLGSTDLITDATGNVVEKTDYLPYGETFSGGNDRFLYTGKEKDADTGLYYYGARYYDPSLTNFIQPDSIIPDVYNPQSLNRYVYTLNNPYRYVDEEGNLPILAPMAIGAGVGLASYLISHAITGEKMSWQGAAAYTAGGALGVGAGVVAVAGATAAGLSSGIATVIGGITSGGISQVSTNVGEGKTWSAGLEKSMALGGLAGGVASTFPSAATYKIKYFSSYFATKTGQTAASNLATEEGFNFLLDFAPGYLVSSANSKGSVSSGNPQESNTGLEGSSQGISSSSSALSRSQGNKAGYEYKTKRQRSDGTFYNVYRKK